jgi:outer membrane receptor for ferrienterochelin and colicin
MKRAVLLVVCAFAVGLLVPVVAGAQQQSAAIRGIVVDAVGQRFAGATVRLLDSLGSEVAITATEGSGRFAFEQIPPGTYTVLAEASSQRSAGHVVSVQTALPLEIELRLAARAAETVIVDSTAEAPSVATRTTLAGSSVQLMPSALRSRALQDALATLPGWASEDNGLLHVRGVDDGFLYVQDGVPVYDRVDAAFGIATDPASVATVHVLTGYIPPEFGLKSGAVIEVQSTASRPSEWIGSVDVGAGSDSAASTRVLAGGPLSRRFSVGGSFAAERSGRFLDPVHPDNLHNVGGVLSGNAHARLAASETDLVRLDLGMGRSRYQVPHGADQDAAGQDQRQRLMQQAQSGSWQRFWSDRTVSQVAIHRRAIDATLQGSPQDLPLSAYSDRRQERAGVLASITRQAGRHTVKGGIDAARLNIREDFAFAITGAEAAEDAGISERAAAFTLASPFQFRGRASRAQWSGYAQDEIRAADPLTVSFGLRFDRTNLLVPASQWSPRAGAAYRWQGTGTTLRASINRLFQPPQPEHLLLSSSPAARVLSPFVDPEEDEADAASQGRGGADIEPERQTAWEVGLEQWLSGTVRFDAAYWRRHVRNYSDPNVLFGTTVVFPNSVARGRAEGVDVRLEVPRYRGWSGYLSYTNSRIVQFGPINGGLFLEHDTLEIGMGTAFVPDHDQRHVAASGLSYAHEAMGFSASVLGRYASGTPVEIDGDDDDGPALARRPGADLVDFERGRVRPRTVFDASVTQTLQRVTRADLSLRLVFLNLFNEKYAFNFGNPFSGTHFGAPRAVRLEVRLDIN